MKILPVVILAGGMGTRIAKKYTNIPKALVPLLNRPFLSWKLDELEKQGVSEVILILGKGEAAIRKYIEGSSHSLKITILSDGENLLGTAGAIRKQLNNLPEVFILTYGDNLLGFDIDELCKRYFESLLPVMVCTSQKGIGEEYNASIRDGKIVHYSKTESLGCDFVEYGYLILRKSDFARLPSKESIDLGQVIVEIIEADELIGLATNLKYYEIGTPEGIEATEHWLRNLRPE